MWSIGVQREVPFGFIVDSTYVGRRGLYQPRERNINQLPVPGTLGRPGRETSPRCGRSRATASSARYEEMLSLYGIVKGLRHARKHLGWYLDRHAAGVSAELRAKIMTSLDPVETIRDLRRKLSVGVGTSVRKASRM